MNGKPLRGRVAAIVQARLGSSRLPLKSLLDLRGMPIIDWVLHRLSLARHVDQVIVAIPDTPLDKVLLEHLERKGAACFQGPENDVLARFTGAARACGADYVVRVCADNPLVWGEAIDRLIEFYSQSGCDYAYNHIPRGNLWPDGLGAEMVARPLLEDLALKACLPAQREHCLNYIWDNADAFRIATFDPLEDWLCRPDLKLDIDNPDDFRRLALLPLAPDMDARAVLEACAGAD